MKMAPKMMETAATIIAVCDLAENPFRLSEKFIMVNFRSGRPAQDWPRERVILANCSRLLRCFCLRGSAACRSLVAKDEPPLWGNAPPGVIGRATYNSLTSSQNCFMKVRRAYT